MKAILIACLICAIPALALRPAVLTPRQPHTAHSRAPNGHKDHGPSGHKLHLFGSRSTHHAPVVPAPPPPPQPE